MDEGKPVGIDFLMAGGFVHQAAHGPVRQHHPAELLLDEFRRLAAQDHLAAAHVGFELVQGDFNFPTFGVERGELSGGVLSRVKQSGDESVIRGKRRQAVLP